MTTLRPLLSVEIRSEQDVVAVRQRARQIAAGLGLSTQDQTGLATAVSELARNAFSYAGGGRAEFVARLDPPQALVVRVIDRGPGIVDLHAVLDGSYVSKTGLGLGLMGSQRLSDEFAIDTAPGVGTTVTLAKLLPRRPVALTGEALAALAGDVARRGPRSPLEEVQEQNRELLHTLDALRARQAEVERLNAELAETNRGVVALYAELDDRAESLRRASEYKSRFLSDMTHELRTPLNAVISLAGLLLDRADGELTPEQDKQVVLIQRSATSLSEMVNDLLDLARIESGKTEVFVAPFSTTEMLATLRGMFRSLVGRGPVRLSIEEPAGVGMLRSDERKLTQILRNLISNALKFTEAGTVRVTAEAADDGAAVFTVSDTGIGIEDADLDRIFEDFTQIDGPLQRKLRGTGLGLPLARKLTNLIGGRIAVSSTPGVGTTFVVTVPSELAGGVDAGRLAEPSDVAHP